MVARVVLDTNALLLPFERRVRIEAELERLLGPFDAVVPEACLRELERIAAEGRGARRDNAKLALAFAKRFRTAPGKGPADAAALRLARLESARLFTNDAGLIWRAQKEKVGIVRLKGLSHLILDPADVE